VDFDLSKIADVSEWKKIEGDGIGGINVTAAMSGDQLHITFPDIGSNYNVRNQGNQQKGLWFIKKVKFAPWANQATPAGQAANSFQSESTLFKMEMQFDHTNGPINGTSDQNYGQNVHAACGIIAYDSDQGTDPPLPGTTNYAGVYVRKNRSEDPSGSSHTNQYQSGLFSRNGKAPGDGRIWRNQDGGDATSHDAIVFQAGISTNITSHPIGSYNENMPCGSYATTTPFGPMVKGSLLSNNACRFGGKHLYLACWFGFDTTSQKGGVIRIKKLRYLLQPIAARAALG
tara:strand:+ start:575 stop:1435 length:861 start_codon:yes stop_codon:yes gene_type:complete